MVPQNVIMMSKFNTQIILVIGGIILVIGG